MEFTDSTMSAGKLSWESHATYLGAGTKDVCQDVEWGFNCARCCAAATSFAETKKRKEREAASKAQTKSATHALHALSRPMDKNVGEGKEE